MGEYDVHTVSGKARLAGLLLILLSLLAFVIGGLGISSAVGASNISDAVFDLFIGGLWIVAGVVGLLISGRIREGDTVMWVIGLIIGLVVMVQTWGFFSYNPKRPNFGLQFSVLDAVAFLLALGLTLLLVFALLDRDRARPRRR